MKIGFFIEYLFISINCYYRQRIVSSIFPEKLIFENKAYRTPKVNSAVALLCRNSKALGGDKKTKHLENEVLSCGVASTRIELVSER